MSTFSAPALVSPGNSAFRAKRNLEYFVSEIGMRWHQTTQKVFEAADLCAEAIRDLPPGERAKLGTRLGFSKGTLSKLIKVSQDDRLRTEVVRPKLPSSYTILYEITRLSNAQLAAAIADGVIHIHMRREDLKTWLPKEAKEAQPKVIATIVGLEHLPEERLWALQARLRQAILEFPEVEVRGKNNSWSHRGLRVHSEAA